MGTVLQGELRVNLRLFPSSPGNSRHKPFLYRMDQQVRYWLGGSCSKARQ
mgnify:CR=1